MKAFPMFIRTTDRSVVVIGGREQAAQKTRLLLKTDADISIIAETLEDELAGLAAEGRVRHLTTLQPQNLKDAAIVFIGTGCPGADAATHAIAKDCGCLVNVVDQPDLCDMTTPAIVDRDPIVVAIGSEGTAPVLTRDIKTRLEEMLPPNIGGLAALAGRLRPSVAQKVPREKRRAFWAWVFKGATRDQWTRGSERAAASAIKSAIAEGGAPRTKDKGHISLVGAGPGARDLLTLRAVERLQEADIIFFDRLVDPDVLELARRDAERIYVGKHVGAHAFPQDKISAMIVAAAGKGQKVVRLKSGDPGIFGRATEEIEAARAAGVSIDIVPGVTAAAAASARLGQSLTKRGETDTFVIATGTGFADAPLPDCTRMTGPGTTTAFYMSARQADRITARLLAQGLPGESPVDVCVEVSKKDEKILHTTIAELPAMIAAHNVVGSAVILISWPRGAEGAAAHSEPQVLALA